MKYPTYISAALCVVAMAACKDNKDKNSSQKGTTSSNASPEQEVKELTLYCGRTKKLVNPLIEMFQKQTGISLKVKYGGSSELASVLDAEGSNTRADLFWSQDTASLGYLAQKDIFAPVPKSIDTKVGEAGGDGWVPVSGRARVLAYSTERVKADELPKDAAALTDAKWKDKIGWAPPNASFQAFVTAMRILEGDDYTEAWLKGVKENGAKPYPKNTPAVLAIESGEIDVALVNHYYLHRLKAEKGEDFPVANHYFKNGKAESFVLMSGIAVLNNSSKKQAAFQFAEFLLSKEAQGYLAGKVFEFPVIDGVAPDAELPSLSSLNAPKVDTSKLRDLKGTVELLQKTEVLK